MAETITTCFQQSILTTAAATATVIDDGSAGPGRVVTVLPAATRYCRVSLAPLDGSGTSEDDPLSLLVALAAALNAGAATSSWSFAHAADGRVVVTYHGSVRAGQFTLDGVLGTALGIGAASLASGASVTANVWPTHCVFAAYRGDDTDWVRLPQRYAAAAMSDGSLYGWRDARTRLRRKFDLRMMPRDETERAALDSSQTPVLPDPTRFAQPSAAPGTSGPWSLYEMIETSAFQRVGACFGTFQDFRVGGLGTYDEIYWTRDTLEAADAQRPTVAGWNAWRDWNAISCTWRASPGLI